MIPQFIQAGLNVFHFVDIFNQALFAGCDDQPLLAFHQWNFGDFLNRDQFFCWLGANVDKSAQAVVLAEIAARGFIAGAAIFDPADGIKTYERCLLTVLPQAQRFFGGPDGS